MKRKCTATIVLLMLMFSSCSTLSETFDMFRADNPEEQWAQAVRIYIYASDTTTMLHEDGRIDDDQFRKADEVLSHISRALDEWNRFLSVGLDPDEARKDYEKHVRDLDDILPDDSLEESIND